MKRTILAVFFLAGCGGGGGGTGTAATPTPAGAAVSMATFKGIYYGTGTAGTQIGFTLSGSDLQGNSWTGSITTVSDGATTFESQNVTKSRSLVTLQRGSGTPVNDITSRYFLASNSNAYKAVSSLGVTSVPTSQTILPDTIHVGDFGDFLTSSNSDGTTSTTTWKLEPDYNGNSKFTVSAVIKTGTTVTALEDDSFYLDASGVPYKMSITSTVSGTTITMSGPKN